MCYESDSDKVQFIFVTHVLSRGEVYTWKAVKNGLFQTK